jgi:hypothetical protein
MQKPPQSAVTRRDLLRSASAVAAVPLLGSAARSASAADYDPSMSQTLSAEELARYKDPARLAHLTSARPLVNRDRANEIMDCHGLDALLATQPANVYYLSSHDNAFYHTGIEHMLVALLPRRVDAPLVFADGTVFTIDVPYLEIGYGSSHVEDMMVCTAQGVRPLSSGDVSLRVRPA